MQVRNVDQPSLYVKANEDKEEVEQEQNRIKVQRQQDITEAETRLLSAQLDASIAKIRAQASSNATLLAVAEKARVQTTKWAQLQAQLELVRKELPGITIEEFVREYVQYYVISNRQNSVVVLDS